MRKNVELSNSLSKPDPPTWASRLCARLAFFARWALCPHKRLLVKIVPHAGDTVYKLEVSHRQVTSVAAAALLLVAAMWGIHVGDVRAAESRARMLQGVEIKQRQELAAFSKQTQALWQKVDRLQRDNDEIHRLTRTIVPRAALPKTSRKTASGSRSQYSLGSGTAAPALWQRLTLWFHALSAGNGFGFAAEAADLSSLISAVARTQGQTSLLESSVRDAAQRKIAAELARRRYLAAIPSIWPTLGYVSSGFGYRSYPDDEFHPGLDIVNDYGSPIYATAAGTVVEAGWYGGYGLRVVIDHGNGLQTMYAHAARLLVNAGDVVHKGQQIGTIGETGYATGPHVHYQVELWGKPVDPTPYLEGSIKVVAADSSGP